MTPSDFLAKFGPVCVLAMLRNGGYASVRLAQIALESNWAKSTPKDIDNGRESFNLTGVKGRGPAGSVRCWTWEHIEGKDVQVIDEFRAYDSFEQHVLERDRIFAWDNYDAYRRATTPEEACEALVKAPLPYATDPAYASKLVALIDKYDLKRFDRYVFVDVPGEHRFAEDLRELRDSGFVRGDENGRLAMSDEGQRILVVMNRIRKASLGHATS